MILHHDPDNVVKQTRSRGWGRIGEELVHVCTSAVVAQAIEGPVVLDRLEQGIVIIGISTVGITGPCLRTNKCRVYWVWAAGVVAFIVGYEQNRFLSGEHVAGQYRWDYCLEVGTANTRSTIVSVIIVIRLEPYEVGGGGSGAEVAEKCAREAAWHRGRAGRGSSAGPGLDHLCASGRVSGYVCIVGKGVVMGYVVCSTIGGASPITDIRAGHSLHVGLPG